MDYNLNTETRDEIIGARVTKSEKAALAALAKDERRTPSEVLRWLVVETARSRGLWPAGQLPRAKDADGTKNT